MNEPATQRTAKVSTTSSVTGETRERIQKLRLSNDSAAKSRSFGMNWLPWVLCAGMAFAWAGFALRSYRNPTREGDSSVAQSNSSNTASSNTNKQPTTNSVVPAGTTGLEVKGYIFPAQQISVSPIDVGGRIIELDLVEGKVYPANHVLARIDPTSYLAQLDEAKQSLKAAQERETAALNRWQEQQPRAVRDIEIAQATAELDEATALELRAKQEIDRIEGLKGTVSIREVQQAEADYSAAKARRIRLKAALDILKLGPRNERLSSAEADYKSARADVDVAKARVAQAEWRVKNCEIRMPIKGTVLSKKAEKWNLVNPMAFSGGGGAICDIADLSDLEVEVEIAERDISKIKVGQACTFRPDSYPQNVYNGRLDRIMPIANRDKNIIMVRVKLDVSKDQQGVILRPSNGGLVSFLPDNPAK